MAIKLRYLFLAFLFFPFGVNAATQESVDLAQQMYVAYYGRPGDPGGVNYWADRFDASADLNDVLANFGNSQEYSDSFGSLENEALVNGLFQQMFNRDSDPGGLAFYVDRLESGVATLASIAKQIADGSSHPDLQSLNNKINVANVFTERVEAEGLNYGDIDITSVRAILIGVSSLSDSVATALGRVTGWTSGTLEPTEPTAKGYCAANIPELTSTRGNVYVFEVPSGDCVGIAEDNSPKKTIPLTILETRIDNDITENVSVQVEEIARLYLRTEGFNVGGFDLYYTFEITNNSAHDYCIDMAGDFLVKDDAGNVLDSINVFGNNSGPELFLNRSQRCFSPGYTQNYIAQSSLISPEDFDKIASFEIGRVDIDPLRDASVSSKAEELDAQMNWTIATSAPNYPALRATFTNSIGKDIRLDKSHHKVWFFDDEGYALSNSFVRLHEALGLDDDDELVEDDYVILGNGETFSLLDEVADNAAVTPSRATKIRVYLRWEYAAP